MREHDLRPMALPAARRPFDDAVRAELEGLRTLGDLAATAVRHGRREQLEPLCRLILDTGAATVADLYSGLLLPAVNRLRDELGPGNPQVLLARQCLVEVATRLRPTTVRSGHGRIALLTPLGPPAEPPLEVLAHILEAARWQMAVVGEVDPDSAARWLAAEDLSAVVVVATRRAQLSETIRLARSVRASRSSVPLVLSGVLAARRTAALGAAGLHCVPRLNELAAELTRLTSALSSRDLETIGLVAQGLPNATIADRLGVAPDTIKTRLSRLYARTGAADRTALITLARDRGWL